MAEPLKTEDGPLTAEAVTEAVKGVDWYTLCDCLRVPDSKRAEIEVQCLAEDRRSVLVDWWLSTDPAPSWRRLIHRLDYHHGVSSCRKAADKIRCNAEPVQHHTLTLHNVTTAIESVEDWDDLGYHLLVPYEKRGSKEEMLQYFITTMPNASWQTLAEGLYRQREHAALERVTEYFQPQPEATLTVANLCSALQEVVEWDDLAYSLGVSTWMQREIEKKYSNDTQYKQAMLEEWRNHHPAPSWMLVANALYTNALGGEWGKYHKVLQLVIEEFLKDVLPSPLREVVFPPPSPELSPDSRLSSSLNRLSMFEIEYSDLEFMEKVGCGGSGTVSKGRWISKNKIVAIKTIIELEEREVRILSSLDHPSIIHYYGTAKQNNVHYIVTEFADNGSIYNYIHKEHKQPPLSRILLWAAQVAEGMVYLHQQDIIHRDLKSSNVVLTSALKAKICDLGSARSLAHPTQQTTAVGTYAWMAPEMLRREEVSKSCDVYSYGVLIFEMATQQLPFPDVVPIEAAVMTMNGKRQSIPETCDSRLADLIKCCWKQDAKPGKKRSEAEPPKRRQPAVKFLSYFVHKMYQRRM